MRFWRPTIAAVLSSLLGLAGAELTLRAIAASNLGRSSRLMPRLPLTYDRRGVDAFIDGRSVLMPDRDIGWITTPNHRADNDGWHQRHNASGLRADVEYSRSPAARRRRFSAYGDSFTYCTGVDLRECWTEFLAGLLPDTEVLNFGVPAYGTDQAWLRYQHGGASWKPCAVLIGHFVEDIDRVVNRFRPFLEPGTASLAKPRYVRRGDELVLLRSPVTAADELTNPIWVEANLGSDDAWYFPGMFVATPLDRFELARLIRTAHYQIRRWRVAQSMYRRDSEALDVLTRIIQGFVKEVRRDGSSPVVVIFPGTKEIVAERDYRGRSYQALIESLENRGIPLIDMTGPLGEAARRSTLSEIVQGHYRPLANRLVAQTLAERLPHLTGGTCRDDS